MKADLAERRGATAKGRVALRQERNREALVQAGYRVISEKGIDAATMQEIASLADVGAGTVYSYFKSKDDLAISVMEHVMHDLALRIEEVTNSFSDPAQVYAFGVRTVLDHATGDLRWKQLLTRPEVIADAMFRCLGPFAMRDLRRASDAGRFIVTDAAVIWKMSTYSIVGISLAITQGRMSSSSIPETVVRLLCMTGIGEPEATELAERPRPAIRAEKDGF